MTVAGRVLPRTANLSLNLDPPAMIKCHGHHGIMAETARDLDQAARGPLYRAAEKPPISKKLRCA